MGSMLKFDSERRELVRERRNARIQRKDQRRQALQRKRTEITGLEVQGAPYSLDPAAHHGASEPVLGAQRVEPSRPEPRERAASHEVDQPARNTPEASATTTDPPGERSRSEARRQTERPPRVSRRERDIAQFRERREQVIKAARREAQERIRRAGEPVSVADAIAALAHPSARCWLEHYQQLESALQSGRIAEIGALARRCLWTVSRDAARSSHRAKRDPELALAVCVAYAIIARLPRTALASAQRTCPTPSTPRAFWR